MGGMVIGNGSVDNVGSGTINTLNGTTAVPCTHASTVGFLIAGTWVATVMVEGTVDDTTWFTIPMSSPFGDTYTNVTVTGPYLVNCAGLTQVRIKASTYTSGTITITWNADAGVSNYLQNADNLISTGNSGGGSLAISAVFTGGFEEVTNYGNITVTAFSTQAGSFTVQWSEDGVTARADGDTYVVSANSLKIISYGPAMRYFRVIYTNGGVAATLVLQTVYRNQHTKPSSMRIGSAVNDDNDAEMVKAIITGNTPSGTYTNAKLSNNSEQQMTDICDNGGSQAAITVGTSAILANVSGSNLTNRKSLTVYNNGTVLIYFGFTNAVTTSTGTPVVPGTTVIFSVGPSTNVYLISGTASQNVRVTEAA